MAITPSWVTSTEATEVEETYIDKGAVMTPQINPVTDARYAKAKADADRADYVEWPTQVHGQEDQGM
jgi:hypothetical protein